MHVLVSAASRHEATSEIARAIGAYLKGSGHDVDVMSPGDIASLDAYDAVVLGSAVYSGRWLHPATRFLKIHATALATRPVWLFSSGPIGDPPLPAGQQERLSGIGREIHPRDHRVFRGRLDRTRLGILERSVTSVLNIGDGDYRPWEEIRAWAGRIAAILASEAPVRADATTPP
ncbi:MAG TPA: flavodoxin domain-containing protein [Candidatus Limnocylindria bacterium]|nr:flavodoxin domain-containing protein [Candidatus Limnocylindria bacterium]